MFRNIATALAATLLISAAEAGARNMDAVTEQYGKGVHTYFSRDYVGAYRKLTRAIDAGSKDPRCYYFRALALFKLGRPEQAKADLAKGAELETLDRDGYYPVSRSLERVQGRTRLLLEKYRRQARWVADQRERDYNRKRYEQIRRQEGNVLRRPLTIPLENLANPSKHSPAVTRMIDQDEPPLPATEQPKATKENEGSKPDPPLPNETSRNDSSQEPAQPADDSDDLFRDTNDPAVDDAPTDENNPFEDDEKTDDADSDHLFDG